MEAAAVEIRQFLVPPPPLPFPEKVAFTPLLLVNWSGGEGGGIIISPAIASEHARERARDGRGGGGGGGGGVSLSHVQTCTYVHVGDVGIQSALVFRNM